MVASTTPRAKPTGLVDPSCRGGRAAEGKLGDVDHPARQGGRGRCTLGRGHRRNGIHRTRQTRGGPIHTTRPGIERSRNSLAGGQSVDRRPAHGRHGRQTRWRCALHRQRRSSSERGGCRHGRLLRRGQRYRDDGGRCVCRRRNRWRRQRSQSKSGRGNGNLVAGRHRGNARHAGRCSGERVGSTRWHGIAGGLDRGRGRDNHRRRADRGRLSGRNPAGRQARASCRARRADGRSRRSGGSKRVGQARRRIGRVRGLPRHRAGSRRFNPGPSEERVDRSRLPGPLAADQPRKQDDRSNRPRHTQETFDKPGRIASEARG